MVKYISRKTGAIIETECQLLGDWVKFEDRENMISLIKILRKEPQIPNRIKTEIYKYLLWKI